MSAELVSYAKAYDPFLLLWVTCCHVNFSFMVEGAYAYISQDRDIYPNESQWLQRVRFLTVLFKDINGVMPVPFTKFAEKRG